MKKEIIIIGGITLVVVSLWIFLDLIYTPPSVKLEVNVEDAKTPVDGNLDQTVLNEITNQSQSDKPILVPIQQQEEGGQQ